MGGSFNPAHGGHRAISLFAMTELGLTDYWWLVSPGNPLKSGAADMAPLRVRLASAQAITRRSRVRASAIEAQLGTRYTVDTLARLVARYPRRRFIWIMGTDGLVNFHRWKNWRRIARILPIAVINRPGYDDKAVASPAMVWLRRFVRPSRQRLHWTDWSKPALVQLRFRPDPRSASALRLANPHWHDEYADRVVRDPLTRLLLR
jgi:nicotinate-nucleotide adenylyltransferase